MKKLPKPVGEGGSVVAAYWVAPAHGYPIPELTLTVDHGDGTATYIVVDINRMSERVPFRAADAPKADKETT